MTQDRNPDTTTTGRPAEGPEARTETRERTKRPYRTITEQDLRGGALMRFQWLEQNHPDILRRMMESNELMPHLQHRAKLLRETQVEILDTLVRTRHLTNGEEDRRLFPDRTTMQLIGQIDQARHDSIDLAIQQVIETL